MAASESRVLNRVTEILNLCAPGTFSSTLSARNKTRNATAIAAFTAEAGLMILKAIAERPNEFRSPFLEDTTMTSSGNAMPEHIGTPDRILIAPYDGGTLVEGKQTDYQKIESYRNDTETIYDEIPHDEEGSTLAGQYDVWNDRFHFTGSSAVLTTARLPVRADNATLIPEIFENCWIALSVGNAAKIGTGGYESNLIASYGQQGMAVLNAFISGEAMLPEVDLSVPTAPRHTAG